jgi:D-alanyl-D-alanine dipeptidase
MIRHAYAGRLARARRAAGEAAIDAVLVTPSADLVYLLGYDAMQLQRLTALIVSSARDPVLVVPELERPRAAATPAGELVEIVAWKDENGPYPTIAQRLNDPRKIAVADRMLAAHLLGLQATLPQSAFVSAAPVLGNLRVRKDPGEIDLLARAAAGADQAFQRILAQPFEGRTERHIAETLGNLLLETGHDSVSFGIVGSGPNGASPHHVPGDRVIARGDLVVLDFGGRVGGYCSDTTRTVSVGEPSSQAREVHEVVRRAQEAAFHAVRPGIAAEEIDRAARRVIEEAGHGDAFIHRTGHGIGLEEHEEPYIVGGNKQLLEPGMCFSIEPGIYLEDRFGVRIEDIVVVTEDGAKSLNEASRDLAVVT